MATIVGDVTGLQQRQRLSTAGKVFSKCCNIWKTMEEFHQTPKSPIPQRLLRPRVKRGVTKLWLNRTKHESLLRWRMMIQPSSTVIKIWTFLSRQVYIWRICVEKSHVNEGRKTKGELSFFSPPSLLQFLLAPFASTIDMDIISLRLDKRNGDFACWPKYFLIFARYFRYLVIQNKTKPKQTNLRWILSDPNC